MTPPRLAERVLSACVGDAEWRDAIVGDLREEFAAVARRRGARTARRWYWQQALRIAGRRALSPIASRRDPRHWSTTSDADRPGGWRRGWLRDVHHAWRSVWQRPVLTGVIVLTLALALAANATIFSLMDALVLRPYRFDGVDRVVLIASDSPTARILDRESVAPFDFREWQRGVRSVESLAAYDWWDANLSEIDTPEQIPAFRVSPAFFSTLAVQPIVGRTFTDNEATPGQHRKVVMAHALWVRRFGSDPGVVGRTIRLDGEPYEVVGVAPPGFQIPFGAEIWAPLSYEPSGWDERRRTYLSVIGRLSPTATLADARAEMQAFVVRQREQFPDTHGKREVVVLSFTKGMADPGAGPFLGLWQAAAALLLLIGCANIANLLLARGSDRASEFSVRLALGAGRGRLAAQLLIEGAVLAVLGLAASLPLTAVGLALARDGIPANVIRFVPGWQFIAIDLPLLALTAALGAVATILFSVLPAVHASRAGVSLALRASGRTTTAAAGRLWIRHALAAGQVALSLALLFGAGLMLTAADRAVNGSLGFDKHHLLTAELALPARPYEDADLRRQFIARVTERMQAYPAATVVAVTSHLPYGQSNNARQIYPEGVVLTQQEALFADYRRVSPSIFAALRIPLESGRGFTDDDRDGTTPVAIVSRNFARRYWPDQDPLGRRFKTTPDGDWVTVVGISGDVLHNWFMNERRPTVYRPLAQDPPTQLAFVVRTAGDPLALAGDLRRAILSADGNQPIGQLMSMDELVAERVGGLSFIASALGVVAMIAFVLAAAGVYGLMAYTASQRTKEIGVRLALGANRWQVIGLTASRSLKVTGLGLAAGAGLAILIGQTMQSLLRGIVANDLMTLVVLAAIVAIVSALASYLPARNATRIDPMMALRTE